ncbi:MAG: ABC transporter permease, partial [Thermoanaerobaculia bacterium]
AWQQHLFLAGQVDAAGEIVTAVWLVLARWGQRDLARALLRPGTVTLLGRSLALACGVLAIALVIAVPVAWLVARTDLPGRRLWAVLAALPLVFPSYVAAFTFVSVLGPRGVLQGWLEPLGVGSLPPLAYGYSGACLVLGLFVYPYLYLLLVAALRDLDTAGEESSRSLGAGPWRTFFAVVLPRLRPALAGGSLLVVLYTLSDFGAVSIVRFNTFTVAIYNAYSGLFDRTSAAALAAVLMLLAFAAVRLEAAAAGRLRLAGGRTPRPASPVELGGWKWPAATALALLATANLVLPVGLILFWAVRARSAGLPLGSAWGAAANSLLAAAAAALAAVLLALAVAWWRERHPGPWATVVERLARAGYGLPGLVIALALVFFAARWARPLYQSLALLVAAYVIRFLPEALAAARAALAAVPARLEEAARSLGRRPAQVLREITLPLMRRGLLAGLGLVFLTSMKELPATLILRPIGFDTLATRVWSHAAEGIYSRAAVPALLLVAVSALPVYLLVIAPALRPRAAASAPARGR